MAKVFISAGHGGSDSGAIGNGFKEKDLNLSIALACRDYLVANGVEVKMSRTTDEDDGINQEASESNAYGPDVTVSIHNNAGGGDGVEAWYSIVGGLSKTCAENILDEVVKIGQNSRGAKKKAGSNGKDYYGFIRMTKAPAVIVECAFIDNATDIQIVADEDKRRVMGIAIAKGILRTLGVQEKANTPATPAPTPTPAPAPSYKSIEEIAREVIAGKWGNGDDRKNRLTSAGYNYAEVQNAVNALCKNPNQSRRRRITCLIGLNQCSNRTKPISNVNYYPRYFGTSSSIVTALNTVGVASSFNNRKKIAKANGITVYLGTAAQNIKLLNLLKQGKLVKP